jgi:3-hydroxyisobutyrate dehydrogenase
MPALPPGSTWIDMGSNGPAMSRTLAQLAVPAGVHLVDAPVGGGPAQAERGALALYVGGERAAVDDQRPLLRVLADESRIHHLGGPGAGYAGKLMINLLWFGQVIASTEALLVAKGFGVDPAALHAALTTSAVGGAFVDNALTALLSGDYLTSFGLRGCVDELVAACEMARTTETPFALSTLVTDIYRRALDEFGAVDGELMAAALLEKQAGALLRW